MLRRVLLCGWLVLAAPGLAAQDGPKEKIQEAARTVGETVRNGAEAVKEGAKKAGKAVGEAGAKVGQAVKEGARGVKKTVKKAVGHGDKEAPRQK